MTARVLVVDDIFPNIKPLETKLAAEYFDVVSAMNGPDALAIGERGLADIVLLDVMMPGMDGFEVCRRLKNAPLTAHLPVVMVSALDQPSDRLKGLDAGADDCTDEMRTRAMASCEFGIGDPLAAAVAETGLNAKLLLVDDRASSFDGSQARSGSIPGRGRAGPAPGPHQGRRRQFRAHPRQPRPARLRRASPVQPAALLDRTRNAAVVMIGRPTTAPASCAASTSACTISSSAPSTATSSSRACARRCAASASPTPCARPCRPRWSSPSPTRCRAAQSPLSRQPLCRALRRGGGAGAAGLGAPPRHRPLQGDQR